MSGRRNDGNDGSTELLQLLDAMDSDDDGQDIYVRIIFPMNFHLLKRVSVLIKTPQIPMTFFPSGQGWRNRPAIGVDRVKVRHAATISQLHKSNSMHPMKFFFFPIPKCVAGDELGQSVNYNYVYDMSGIGKTQ